MIGVRSSYHLPPSTFGSFTQDAEAVEKLLTFDSDSVRERPKKKVSERDVVDLDTLERGAMVSLTLRTGHRLSGSVRWVTAYDVGLTLDNGAKVHVFKHAISDCQPQADDSGEYF